MADPLYWLYEHIEAQDNPTTLGRLRAVADELERLRAENERMREGLELCRSVAIRSSVDDPPWSLPNQIIHATGVGLGGGVRG